MWVCVLAYIREYEFLTCAQWGQRYMFSQELASQVVVSNLKYMLAIKLRFSGRVAKDLDFFPLPVSLSFPLCPPSPLHYYPGSTARPVCRLASCGLLVQIEIFNGWPFILGFFHIGKCFQGLIIEQTSILHFSLWSNTVPLCRLSIFCLSLVSDSQLDWVVWLRLLWTLPWE